VTLKVSQLIKLIYLETYKNNAEAQIKAFHLIITGDFSSCPEGTRGARVKVGHSLLWAAH